MGISWESHSCHCGTGILRVWVRVRPKLPTGHPCPSLVITGPNWQSALSLPHLFLCIITLWNTIVMSHHINFFSTHHQCSTPTCLTPTKCDETQQTTRGAWGRRRWGGGGGGKKCILVWSVVAGRQGVCW